MTVPDWLEGLVATPDPVRVEPAEPEPAADMPDWLTGISPGGADEEPPVTPAVPSPEASSWDAPDWITSGTTDEVQTEENPGPAVPQNQSWFAQGQDLPSLDWLFDAEPVPASPPTAAPLTPKGLTGWLFDPGTEAPPPPAETETEAEADWLQELDQNASPDWLAEEETSATTPDWLTSLQSEPTTTEETPPPTAGWLDDITEEVPPWLTDTTPPPPLPPAPELPAAAEPPLRNLKSLKRLSPQPEVPLESSLPDWAAGLIPAETETGPGTADLPDWAADLVPPGASAAETADPEVPDWAGPLLPSSPEPKAEPPPAAPPRLLSRLSSIAKPAPETPPPPVLPDETPAWLNNLSTSSAPTEAPAWMSETGPPPGPSSWLSDLPAETDETPDWMAELSRLSQDVSETSGENWQVEESPAEDDSTLMERLGWFTQESPAEPPAPAQAAAFAEPDWLAETPAQAEGVETLTGSAAAETDYEIPAWLSDLPGSAPVDQAKLSGSAPEAELPDWFSTSAESAAPETLSTQPAEADLATLPWLTDVPAADLETPAWLDEAAAEPAAAPSLDRSTFGTEPDEDLGTPDWLTDLLETAEPEAPSVQPVETAESEVDTPPWLAQWPNLTENVPSTETIDNEEMPAWLAGLSETPAPAWNDEAAESELEAPPGWSICPNRRRLSRKAWFPRPNRKHRHG
ncbi:MAG: hypothetical protein HC875_19365 [Anaerolineales bacterium]|nr:hypothetical protein [Anaerolineales bacterium]